MKPPVVTRVQVRFGDFDPRGHVNNVSYSAFLELGRMGFLRTLTDIPAITASTIARIEIDYLRPIMVSAKQVEVAVRVGRLGRTSFTLLQEVSDEHGPAARATAVLVAMEASGASRPLDEGERAVLTAFIDPA